MAREKPRKKRGAPRPEPARAWPRPLAGAAPAAPAYPDARAVVASPVLRRLVRGAARSFAAGGALAVSTLAAGCAEPPRCAADRPGELLAHAPQAVDEAAGLRFGGAVQQLGVGFGLVPHPHAPMMAGEMPAPMPYVAPTPPGRVAVDPSLGTVDDGALDDGQSGDGDADDGTE